MTRTAGILVVGNEILSGKIRDDNSFYFIRELRSLGVDARKVSVVPDDANVIRDEIRTLSAVFHYVFTSGGVGPTHDDMTMSAIGAAFGRRVRRHPELVAALREYYQQNLTDAMLRMADVPEGTRLLRGGGMRFPVVAVENVYVFPGVPEILVRKFEGIKETFREAPFHLRELYLCVDEGHIVNGLERVLSQFPDLLLGSYPAFRNPRYLVKLTLESKDPDYLDAAYRYLLSQLEQSHIASVP